MITVAIYGREFITEGFIPFFNSLISSLNNCKIQYFLLDHYAQFLKKEYDLKCSSIAQSELKTKDIDFVISLGGDGTVLDTLSIVQDTEIPVIGVNLGRFGFLANIKASEIQEAMQQLSQGEYMVEGRSVIEVECEVKEVMKFPYALNDVVVQKRDSSAMITVDTYLDDEFLNSYWADGLITATPTGSSGYSLSCGGPLIFPGSQAFVLTPIAAHNLTVRPAVIPDSKNLRVVVKGRANSVLLSLDSRSYKIPVNSEISLKTAKFKFNMVRLNGSTYMDTIRTKLMWGQDSRNRV